MVLDVFLPPIVLSVTRKPWDYFTFNPWLSMLPEYLASSTIPFERKVEFLPNLVLFWFSADSPYGGVEWGFAVGVGDLLRFIVMALIFGGYFAIWFYRRDRLARCELRPSIGRHGGIVGALTTVLGFSTGPCSVMGCGAPIIPVVGLAFVGLESTTLKLLAEVSRITTAVVLAGMTLAVAYLGWLVGPDGRRNDAPGLTQSG